MQNQIQVDGYENESKAENFDRPKITSSYNPINEKEQQYSIKGSNILNNRIINNNIFKSEINQESAFLML
jgi:hypothetical protein